MIIVKEGPIPLYCEEPNIGRIKFVVTANIEVNNIPKKQYVICSLLVPVDTL
jgi:hypothetical protein